MSDYWSHARPSAVLGMLRAIDLLGSLPLSTQVRPLHELERRSSPLAGDWQTIGRDIDVAIQTVHDELERDHPELSEALQRLEKARRPREAALENLQRVLDAVGVQMEDLLHAVRLVQQIPADKQTPSEREQVRERGPRPASQMELFRSQSGEDG